MRVVALYRVSTERQANEGASLDAQQRRYRELAAVRGWETIAEYRGTESATKAAQERQVLQRVLGTIREQEVDAVWVYEQSRLTRGDELEVALLVRELREREVAVVIGEERIDLSDSSASLVFGIRSVVDREEAARIKERMLRGRRERARQGKRGTSKAPYGYRNPPKGDARRGTLQPHEEEAAIVRRIFAQAASGRSRRQIARALNHDRIPAPRAAWGWSKTAVNCILRNRAYLGQAVARAWVRPKGGGRRYFDPLHPDAIVIDDAHAPLVDAATWEAAHARDFRRGGSPDMLTGLLYVNGSRYVIAHLRRQVLYRPEAGVSGVGVLAEEAHRLVWDGYLAQIRRPAALLALLDRSVEPGRIEAAAEGVERAERTATRLRGRLARLVDMRADGEIDRAAFREQSDATGRQLRAAEEEARSLRRQLAAVRDGFAERRVLAAARLAAVAGKLSKKQKRAALDAVVERIDATILDRGAQTKGAAGRWMGRAEPRWSLGDVYLRLRVAGEGAPLTQWSQSCVTVQIAAQGRVIEPEPAAGARRETA